MEPSSRGLKLESISVQGFISYRDPVEIEFRGGVLGVVGKNGAGKSTIVSKALTWALFGKCAPERMGSGTSALRGGSVVHDDCKDCQVAVKLSRGSDVYEIRRSRKRAGGEVCQVTKNGEIVTDEPEHIVGAGYDVFVCTVVRGQNDPWNFAEATDARKREILDAISGAITLKIALAIAKSRSKEAQADLAKAETTLATLRSSLAGLPDPVAKQNAAEAWDRETQQAIENERAILTQLQAQLADAGPEPTLDRTAFGQQLTAARTAVAEVNAALGSAATRGKLYKQIEPMKACPLCLEVVPATSKVVEAKVEAENAWRGAHERLKSAEQLQREWEGYARQQEEEYRSRHAAWTGTQRVQQQIASHQAQLRSAEQASNPHRDSVTLMQEQRDQLGRQIGYQEAVLPELRRVLQIANEWAGILSPKGVPAHLSESAVAAIEAESNRWLAVLSGGRMSVEISTQKGSREQITVKVTALKGGRTVERDLIQFSGGERTRINLAIDLGVSSVVGRGSGLALSMLVLDEAVFSGLDEDGKGAVAEALVAAGVHDVVVIDHDTKLTGVFARTILVCEQGGSSTVQEMG